MMTCLIVDDEPLAVQLLEDYIRQTDFLYLVHKCHTAMDALGFLKKNEADLLFLDINMPKLTGMELTSLLPADQKIIFTTAYSEYAVQSYEKNAVDYLLKPITFERFMKAAVKAEKLITGGKGQENNVVTSAAQSVFIKSGKAMIKVAYDSILFIEGLKDYVTFHTTTEKLVAYKRMKELEETMPAHFIRIHNSYIVNTQHITRMEENHVFTGEERIPVSEKYRDLFMEKINRRLL